MDNINQEEPVQPEISSQQSNSNLLKTLSIGLGIIGIGIIIGIGGYLLGTKKSQLPVQKVVSQVSPTPTPIDETANWKTYASLKYKFSFKYPNEYIVESGLFDEDVNVSRRLSFTNIYDIQEIKKHDMKCKKLFAQPGRQSCDAQPQVRGFDLYVLENSTKLSEREFLKSMLFFETGRKPIGTLVFIKGYELRPGGRTEYLIFDPLQSFTVGFDLSGNDLNKEESGLDKSKLKIISDETIDQILSTLRFPTP